MSGWAAFEASLTGIGHYELLMSKMAPVGKLGFVLFNPTLDEARFISVVEIDSIGVKPKKGSRSDLIGCGLRSKDVSYLHSTLIGARNEFTIGQATSCWIYDLTQQLVGIEAKGPLDAPAMFLPFPIT